MSSEIVVPVIIYLTLFRLAIIATGMISIVLGYRLFIRGVWPDRGSEADTTVAAEFAGQRFTVKNAAPGTCFALFGVITISVMFATGPPELSQQFTANLNGDEKGRTVALRLRGPGEGTSVTMDGLMEPLKKASRAYRRGDFSAADTVYEQIRIDLDSAGEPLGLLYNEWAVRYLKESKYDMALDHAQVAIMMRPQDDDYIDTYVVATCWAHDPGEALTVLNQLTGSQRAAHEQLRSALTRGRCPADV